MKKKEILKTIITIIVSVVLSSGISVYATSTYLYDSCDVSYDNTSSGLNATNVQSSLDELYMHATDYTSIREMIYPVGSIYISVTDDTVAKVEDRFGGTWEKFGEGRTLISAGTGKDSNNTSKTFAVNSTGGEYEHTLTIEQIPSHNHTVVGLWKGGETTTGDKYVVQGYPHNVATGKGQYSIDTDSKGNNQSHNNIQPYITVYMYKRTS